MNLNKTNIKIPLDEFKHKLLNIKAFISDWDGVFNDGIKTPHAPSPFAEADSMGLNLLRYEFWLRTGKIPPFAVITGADNPTAIYMAKREKFQAVYSQIVFKAEAVEHFCTQNGLEPSEVACFFDDANDLGMAKICGLRFLIRREATPDFTDFVVKEKLCDYVSAVEGGNYAIRQICEHWLTLNQNFEQVLRGRAEFTENYQTYYRLRQSQTQVFFKKIENQLVEFQPDK